MATFRAIAAASEAVVRLLRSSYRPELFDGNELDFQVFGPHDFRSGTIKSGVSLFVYRVLAEGTHRTPGGRRGPNGRWQRGELPLEVHFLLTAWAEEPSLQNTIAGWMMRTLEDTPTLPATLLNAVWSDVFRPDEGLEVVLGDLSTEDLFRIWEVIAENSYQLSAPYVARVIRIESMLDSGRGVPVVERAFEFGTLERDRRDASGGEVDGR